MNWISSDPELSISRQCQLVNINRNQLYRSAKNSSAEDLALMRLIDEEYTRHPFYGSRRMTVYLQNHGQEICRKKVQRLMRTMGLEGMAPKPNTSKSHPQNPLYPYLLRGVKINQPNQVWSSDITYIRMKQGFMYLTVVMDWYSRKVLSYLLSNTLESNFVVEALENALREYGKPEIFNSDQGVQYTSLGFTKTLKANAIQISMDGRGRAADNIFVERLWRSLKYEDIYIKEYANVEELLLGLSKYFEFYNHERPHQGLGNLTPEEVYKTGVGGGAKIVNKWPLRGNDSESICKSLKTGYNGSSGQAGVPMTEVVEAGGLLEESGESSKKAEQRCFVAVE